MLSADDHEAIATANKENAQRYLGMAAECERIAHANTAKAQAIRDRDKLPDLAGMPDGTVIRFLNRDGEWRAWVLDGDRWRNGGGWYATGDQMRDNLNHPGVTDVTLMVEGESLYTGGPADDTQEQQR